MASPLQFGDWIHLCGTVMQDLSGMASRWWDQNSPSVEPLHGLEAGHSFAVGPN